MKDYYATRLAELRPPRPPRSSPPLRSRAIHFDRDNTNPFGRERLRRIAIDAAVAGAFSDPGLCGRGKATQGVPEDTPEDDHGD